MMPKDEHCEGDKVCYVNDADIEAREKFYKFHNLYNVYLNQDDSARKNTWVHHDKGPGRCSLSSDELWKYANTLGRRLILRKHVLVYTQILQVWQRYRLHI